MNVHSLLDKVNEFRHFMWFNFWCNSFHWNLMPPYNNDEIKVRCLQHCKTWSYQMGGQLMCTIYDNLHFKKWRDDLCVYSVECIWVEITPFRLCAVNPDGTNTFSDQLSAMLSLCVYWNERDHFAWFQLWFHHCISSKEINNLKFVCNMFQLQQLIMLATRGNTYK